MVKAGVPLRRAARSPKGVPTSPGRARLGHGPCRNGARGTGPSPRDGTAVRLGPPYFSTTRIRTGKPSLSAAAVNEEDTASRIFSLNNAKMTISTRSPCRLCAPGYLAVRPDAFFRRSVSKAAFTAALRTGSTEYRQPTA